MITQNINHFNENNNNIQEAEENLLSIEGIEMRVNRSSQVEGAFGVIKQDFQYERFRRCSLAKVSLEFMLVCLGYNIRKLFVIIMEKLNLIVGKFLKILH